MEMAPRLNGSLDGRPGPSSSSQRADKAVTGSGSSEDSMASELGRLSEENAHYRRKISELMGKSAAQPTQLRTSSGPLGGASSLERLRDQLKNMKRENARLAEVNNNLERRISSMRMSASSDQLWRCKEEIRTLRRDNADLLKEKQKFDRTAEYVCQRVLKIIGAARREGNFNSQLVGELKRWNEKLEEENHRLYSIIERMQNKHSVRDRDDLMAEANVLSKNHDRDKDGNVALVKQLETQNVKLQEEISKLSDQAISLQNLSSSSSGSSGLAAPRTPSNHEDGPGDSAGRRSRTPERDAIAASERLRSGDLNRRKSRQMSLESISSAATKELENDQLKVEKKNLEEEISRIGKHLDEIRRESSLSKELQASNAQQTIEIQKLLEASAQVKRLEAVNAVQAAEIERLLEQQLSIGDNAKAATMLKDEYAELEDDCLKLAAEVERLQPLAERTAELEASLEAHKEELAMLRSANASTSSDEVLRLREDNVEIQRTLEMLAAEKSILQAQLREVMEEQARLQNENKLLRQQADALQERAEEAAALKAELASMGQLRGQNATYRDQLGSLRSENATLQKKTSDLARQLAETQSSPREGSKPLAAGQGPGNRSFSSYTMETRYSESSFPSQTEVYSESNFPSQAEIDALRIENKELSAQASRAVEMNVELTSLRNQIKTHEESERMYEEHAELIKHLKAENAALQRETTIIASLKAEISRLKSKILELEDALRRTESEMAGLLNSNAQAELSQQHASQASEINALQARCDNTAAEVSRKEAELAALQLKHDALIQDYRSAADQASRSLDESDNELAVLHMALNQEKAENARVSSEAAELHSLLQTGKMERQAQVQCLAEMREENSALLQRVAELDAKNDEQEKMLATVLSRNQGNGQHYGQAAPSLESGVRPHTPRSNETAMDEVPHVSNGYYSNEEGWQSANISPFKQMNGDQMNGALSDKTSKSGANGRTKGFGNFFKRGSNKKAEKNARAQEPKPASKIAYADPTPSTTYDEDPEEEVISVYERFVDHDDIDGFMAALGYEGFVGPTEPEDLEGAFVSARYACRPEACYGRSQGEQAKCRATLELLEAWQAAWQAALSDA